MTDDVPIEMLEAGRGYEALFVPALFAPWPGHLLARAEIATGARVLDVACGSGVLARAALDAVGDTGSVTGLDPAPGMIGAAREIEPRVDWILGAAEDLPMEAASFDAVVSQFGMMFFDDRDKAATEMLRVLAPGGRLAVAVWDRIEENPAYRDIVAVLDEEIGTAAGDAVRMPFTLGDRDALRGEIEEIGFADVGVETLSEQARFPNPRTMVEAELRGWLPLFGIHLEDAKIDEVLERSDNRLSRYAKPSGEAVFPTSAHIVTGRKP